MFRILYKTDIDMVLRSGVSDVAPDYHNILIMVIQTLHFLLERPVTW